MGEDQSPKNHAMEHIFPLIESSKSFGLGCKTIFRCKCDDDTKDLIKCVRVQLPGIQAWN